MTASTQDCKHCQKSSLSLLLLRPSPLAHDPKLRPEGADKVAADAALVKPFVPTGLKQSKPVLRLLRAGYVHLYIPSRDTGNKADKPWHTWRVTEQADMLAEDHPLFANLGVNSVCSRTGHNASGFKLIQIPDAAELTGETIWLAFSANLWSNKLKEQNKANSQAMIKIKLGETKTPAFKPTAEALKKQVLECNVVHYPVPLAFAKKSDAGTPSPNPSPAFFFTSLARDGSTQHMVDTLRKAAAKHEKTTGHELAVVLPDPVGYAAELNALRLQADRQLQQLSPADEHKLQSHFALQGLANNVADIRGLNNVAPIISRSTFEQMRKSNTPHMQSATWEPLQPDARPSPQQEGRMWTPQARQTFEKQAPEFEARARKEIESGYSPEASQAWLDGLLERTRTALAPYEQDWLTGRDLPLVGSYFALHFDDEARNRPGTAQSHSPGAAYVQEVSSIDGPPPKTSVTLLDTYVAAYQKKPDDPHAFALRVLVANQKTLLQDLIRQLSGDPNADKDEGGGMRDKSVDFIKGLLDVKGQHFQAKYSWLSDATLTMAMGPMNHLAATTGIYATLAGTKALSQVQALTTRLKGIALWVAGVNNAFQAHMTQVAPRPVLVQFWVDNATVDESLLGPGKRRKSSKARSGGKTLTTILTDTERLRKGPADLQALMASQDALSVIHGKTAGAVLAARTSGAVVLNLAAGMSPQQGATLFKQQVEEARTIAGSVRAAIPTGLGAVTMSVDGRLALASVIVQTVGVINGRQAVETAEANLKNATEAERAEKEKALRDAKLGYMDSIGGLVAGSMDTLRVAGEAMNLQRGAAAGAAALNSIHALKFGAQVAGVFGGILNGYVSYLKAGEAMERNLIPAAGLHFVSMLSFGGTSLAAGAPIAAGGLSFLAARNIGGRVIQSAATRMTAATVAGAWIPVAGWVLLGIGITASVGAALLEPTKLEAWARRTPFGKGPEAQKFKTLSDQEETLYEALRISAQSATREAQAA